MTRRIAIAIALAGAAQLSAHDDYRIVGTITNVQPSKLGVKSRGGRDYAIEMSKGTVVNRDKTKAAVTDLKVGQSVVVDATGDTEDDLLALKIRIVPPIAKK
jgi:hypothetical protein